MPAIPTLSLRVLTVGNPKIVKGSAYGVLTAVLHLLPAREYARLAELQGDTVVRLRNLCPWAASCVAGCLNTAGRGGIPSTRYAGGPFLNNVQQGRYRRTRAYDVDPARFVADVVRDIERLAAYCAANGLSPAIRLNGTSDVDWYAAHPELVAVCERLNVARYDYTKDPARARASADGTIPMRYVYSLDKGAAREAIARDILSRGGNVAVVFRVKRGQPLPASWSGYPVLDGDVTDLRHLDPRGHVVGLRAKGRAIRDTSGFVREP